MLKRIKNIFTKNIPRIREEKLEITVQDINHEFSRRPFSITVHYASGGIILNTRQYNRKIDEHEISNYVVHDGDDISKTIEKIIFMEQLKQ
jgi:hypothetical protein